MVYSGLLVTYLGSTSWIANLKESETDQICITKYFIWKNYFWEFLYLSEVFICLFAGTLLFGRTLLLLESHLLPISIILNLRTDYFFFQILFPFESTLLRYLGKHCKRFFVRSIVRNSSSKKQSFSWCGSQNSDWKYTVWAVTQYHLKENKYCQRFKKKSNDSNKITFSTYKNLDFIWWWI